MFATGKDGMSALGLQRALEIGSYPTAWAMLHRLRSVLVRPGRERLTGMVLAHPSFVALPSGADAERTGGPGADAQLAGAHQMSGGELFTTADVMSTPVYVLATLANSGVVAA